MNTYGMRSILCGMCSLGVAIISVSAYASHGDLIDTLETNEVISTEEAETLREKAPKYKVRPAGGVVEDLAIRGRVQSQFGYVSSSNDEGRDDYSTFEIRRARLGLRGTLPGKVRAQLEGNFVPGSGLSMRSAFLQWRAHKPAYIQAGYDKPTFGFEENTSSGQILTVERTLINNMLVTGPTNGLALSGVMNVLEYGAGIYTDRHNRNAVGTDDYLYNATLGLRLNDIVPESKIALRADFLASDDEGGSLGGKLNQALAVSAHIVWSSFDLRAEFMNGMSDDNNLMGFYVTPSFYVNSSLQMVARFEQAYSDSDRGIRAPSRYVRNVDSLSPRDVLDDDGNVASVIDPQRGDSYQAVYAGVNYYISGHQNKLMFGFEFGEVKNTDLGNLQSVTASTAWRMLF